MKERQFVLIHSLLKLTIYKAIDNLKKYLAVTLFLFSHKYVLWRKLYDVELLTDVISFFTNSKYKSCYRGGGGGVTKLRNLHNRL